MIMSNKINILTKRCLLFIWLIATPIALMVFAIVNDIYTFQSFPWLAFIISTTTSLLLFAATLRVLVIHMKLTKTEPNKATKLIKVNLIVQMLIIILSILFIIRTL